MDEVDPELIKTFNKLGIPFGRTDGIERNGGGCRDGLGICKDYFQRDVDGERHYILLIQ